VSRYPACTCYLGGKTGLAWECPVHSAVGQQRLQHQTHTRPVRLYNEDREEVEVQAAPAERACPRCGRLPGCLCHLFEPPGKVVVSFEDREEEVDVDVVTMQDEVECAQRTAEEADKVYDSDRPYRPEKTENALRYTRALLALVSPADPTAPTVGELIDRLTIVNVKIYHLEDTVMESDDSETVAAAAKKTRALNRERSDLKNAITRLVQGSGARMDTKT